MHSSMSNHSRRRWIAVLVAFLAGNFPFSYSDPRIFEAGFLCGNAMPPPNTSYIQLFVRAMEVISQQVTVDRRGSYAVNSTNISVYVLAQCHDDLSKDDCLQCYAAARTRLPRCLPIVAGRIFLDGCFLRYDSYSFFNESVSPLDKTNCSTPLGAASAVESEFARNFGDLADRLTASAVVSGGYAVRENKGVFGLAQCWSTVPREACRACLVKANKQIRECLPQREGRALYSGCYLRYSTQKFYSNQSNESNSNSGSSRRGIIVAIALSVLAFCLLSLFAGYAVRRRWKKRKQEHRNLKQILFTYNKSSLSFKYETLEKATNYFDPLRKVGQGGAGSVYRGTLPNGKTVAVKRLFFSTRQWVDEFFNEVNLISGIEHKNLVKLLGCSIEGPESLLVYEFVPNKSLDQYLFDRNKVNTMSWNERYNVIVGTAEGITFLHEGLESRIIHRDIKSSNVLLDENLDPKIADFGLARMLGADKTHLSTGIAGTLGYMAPEYLVKGQLTEKADVYSFGVLVMEVVSGRKNNVFVEGSGSLVQIIWKLYKTGRAVECVDPALKDEEIAENEVQRVVRVGLLCAQAYAAQRPSMGEVVKMLREEDYDIREPNQPPFLNTGGISGSTTTTIMSSNTSLSLLSNAATMAETSNPSTGAFSDGYS
ncbi:cysteine-rich receptor-like protein kinase 42 isoform X2 [Andrographis paniculata]|uniref:cysteine-rich receptor-like protein kinase 42 isoform X2 n=2 Tax=Andrographis paniculata TaxID=175694 RepID=UPI0021E9A5C2|nr:cysteine-rich receptor-like protein kinase 42 isoform X2 [Andrographis paniculata]